MLDSCGGPLPATAVVLDALQDAIDAGRGSTDFAVVAAGD